MVNKLIIVPFVYIPADTAGYGGLEEKMKMKKNMGAAEKKMDMEQFAESIRSRIEQQGQFEKVSLQNVLKNNGIMRRGLLLCSSGKNMVPTIYLEPFFGAYEKGVDMEKIIRKILEAYESAPCEEMDTSFLREFSTVKDRLCMKLVNRDANTELLEKVPYREFLDMAVVYYVDYYAPQVGGGTIQVYNSHMEMWGVTEENLWETASINTPKRKAGRIEKMEDVLADIFEEQDNGNSECPGNCTGMGPMTMLVITNTARLYGAVAVLYSGMLKQAADKACSDLFILPSSLHEVIAVPASEGKEAAGLKEMVMEVNRAQLLPEEVLSDNVYIYQRKQDRLEIA